MPYYARDRLVSLYAKRHNFTEDQTFHSPLETTIAYAVSVVTIVWFTLSANWSLFRWPLAYLAFAWYVVAGSLHHCFIVGRNEFIILNRNPPWWRTRKIGYSNIEQVKIGKSKWLSSVCMLILIWGEAIYIQVTTKDGSVRKFYGMALESDYYDENTTRHTIDHLEVTLHEKGIKVKMENIYDD